jgi:hypothetical protein
LVCEKGETEMRKKLFALIASWTLILTGFAPPIRAQQQSAYVAGVRIAQQYAYGYGNVSGASVAIGNSATGTQTVTVCPGVRTTADGRQIVLFSNNAPVTFDQGFASQETVTPTAVSLTVPGAVSGVGADQSCAHITGSFSFTHAASQFTGQVRSGSFGLQEAINDAAGAGTNGLSFGSGGNVVIAPDWGGTDATITAAIVYPNVNIVDYRKGTPQSWLPQGGATTLAAPATLIAATAGFGVNGANFTGGFYTGSNTYIACIAYVDLMGQEGPCSATFTIATSGVAATDQIGFTAPAASTGAIGYTIYITLTGGAYTSAYKVPLVTQPTVVGAYPVSNGVCTLTQLESITPACALTNATYGQTGVGAVVSALTLNTSPIEPQSTIVSTTSIYVPNPGGRTTYSYVPGLNPGASAITVPSALAFTIGAAAGTTVPDVLGTINLRPGAMNFVGKKLRVCGEATTTASTATIVDIQFQWDAIGQNTAGKGVVIGDLTATPAAAIATAGHATFCQDFQTTVASASATGGSVNHVNSFGAVGGVSLIAPGALSDALTPGAVGSLNLAGEARINVIYLHTTATDGAGWTLQNLTAQVI